MSPALIALLLQEIAANAPGIIADFQKGNVTPEQQQAIFDAVSNLSDMFSKPQWQKRTDI